MPRCSAPAPVPPWNGWPLSSFTPPFTSSGRSALVQAPLKQVVVFKNDLLRIEPYATPLPIQPLK